MMKKLTKYFCAVIVCGAFLMPCMTAYAEENPEVTESVVESEVVETAEIPVISSDMPDIPDIAEENIIAVDIVPKGNGSLIEDVTNDNVNRQFITVQSKNGHVFYIIIDNDGKTENVYFLNAVDEYDLMAFAENFPEEVLAELEADNENSEDADNSDGENTPDNKTDKSAKSDDEKADNSGGGGMDMNKIISVILIALGVIALIYFKVIKAKKGAKPNKNAVYDDEEEYEEDEPVNEDNSDDESEDV